MKQIMAGAEPQVRFAARHPRRASTTLLFAAAVVIAYWPQPASALTFNIDTVQTHARDTLLMTNQAQDTLTIDSITGRVLVLHTGVLQLNGAVLVRNPSGPGGSNVSFGCWGHSLVDSLLWSCGSGPSRIPPTYAVWVQSPTLDAGGCPTSKRLNAAAGDTMAVMVTFHSGSGDDSVVFFNGNAGKACTTSVRESPTPRQPHAMSPAAGTLEEYTIRGERLAGGAFAAVPRSTAMLVVRKPSVIPVLTTHVS